MKFNYITVILVIASLAIGYYLNTLANERNNQKLIALFKAELEAMNNAKQRATPIEQMEISKNQEIIQAKIDLLEQL